MSQFRRIHSGAGANGRVVYRSVDAQLPRAP